MSADEARRWLEGSPWARALGVEARALAPEGARLHLPFRPENTNPGGVLHGGVAASLVALAAGAVARAGFGPEAGPFHVWG
ncbi:MAG TPA: hypothetical protein VIN04_01120, partial [Myxococcota bacterium]